MLNKIIVGIIVCLLLVVGFELIYTLFLAKPPSSSQIGNTTGTAQQSATQRSTSTGQQTSPISGSNGTVQQTAGANGTSQQPSSGGKTVVIPNQSATQVISAQHLVDYLSVINSDVLVSSLVNNNYKGIVTEVHAGSTYKPEANAPAGTVGKLVIKGLTKGLTDTFFFTQQNMSVLEVKDTSGGKNTGIQLTDLKTGDTVEIKESLDFTKPLSQFKQSIEIDKL